MELPVKYTKLTRQERRKVRLEYIRIQHNKCWYCDGNLDKEPPQEILNKPVNRKWFPEGFFDNPIHLQHNHNTDLTEGAVHAYCNAVLWEYYAR